MKLARIPASAAPCAPSKALCPLEKADGCESGTTLALYKSGCFVRQNGWGGARNRADRESDYLTAAQCHDLIDAAHHADRIGMPFNRHWTVHYERAGLSNGEAARFIGNLIKLVTDWARRHGGRIAAAWVREDGEGKGGHVHILLHLPPGMTLRGRTRRWVRLAGGWYRNRVSRVETIGPGLAASENNRPSYDVNVAAVAAYLLKGCHPTVGEQLGLDRYGEGGRVVGKRCGWTQNIGRKARGEFLAAQKGAARQQVEISAVILQHQKGIC